MVGVKRNRWFGPLAVGSVLLFFYLPILIMSLFTILRMAFQYSRFKKANTPVLPK